MEVRVLFRALSLYHQGVAAAPAAEVDGGSSLINEAGDKMVTNWGVALPEVAPPNGAGSLLTKRAGRSKNFEGQSFRIDFLVSHNERA